ncbi:MAG: discoidin domain-containing protein, partial [Candidatus Omnitrophica bacterium]|nr:discoidin domain-containing protein [Candidatus Omnitrophota bacterium]
MSKRILLTTLMVLAFLVVCRAACAEGVATFHFNSYDSGVEEWTTTPANMADGSIATYAVTETDADVELLNGNNCSGVNFGAITKVEIRAYGYTEIIGHDIILRPVFSGGDGTNHTLSIGTSATWSSWIDITTDTNAPGTWAWTDVQNLDCDVESDLVAPFDVFCSKVEIRVTHAFTYSQTDYTQDTNCQGAWLFVEGSGTTVGDASGNTNTGNFKGTGEPVWAATSSPKPYSSRYVNFDGADDYINSGDVADLTGNFTIVMWINADTWDTAANDYNGLISKRDDSAGMAWELFYMNAVDKGASNEGISFWWGNSGANEWQTQVKPSTGSWHHLAITRGGNNFTVYLDGINKASTTNANVIPSNTDNVRFGILGADETDVDTFFDGTMDEVAIFDRVLSPAEIQDIMDYGLKGGAPFFESDFETADLTEWDTSSSTGVTLSASATAKHLGSYGLLVDVGATPTSGYVQEDVVSYNMDEVYARFFVKFASTFDLDFTDEIELFRASDISSGALGRIYLKCTSSPPDMYYLWLNQTTDTGSVDLPGSGTSGWNAVAMVTDGLWHSVEYHFKAGSGSDGVAELFIDGVDRANGADNYDMDQQGFSQLRLGLVGITGGSLGDTEDLYFDDVKVDDTGPIGAGAYYKQWFGINSSHLDSDCGFSNLTGALDGTWYADDATDHVHWIILDLGQDYNITKVRGRSQTTNDPLDVDIYVSTDKITWGTAVASNISTWYDTGSWVEVDTTDKTGRYVKIEVEDTESALGNWCSWGGLSPHFSIFDVYTAEETAEFVSVIKQDGTGDYTSLVSWQAGVQCDLTGSVTGEWDNQIGSDISDGTAVSWYGGTGTLRHMTTVAKSGTNAFLIVTADTLEDNDVVTDGVNSFQVNGVPKPPIAVAKI